MGKKLNNNFNFHKYQYTFCIFLGLAFITLGLATTIYFWQLIYSNFWYLPGLCIFSAICGLIIIVDVLHDMKE